MCGIFAETNSGDYQRYLDHYKSPCYDCSMETTNNNEIKQGVQALIYRDGRLFSGTPQTTDKGDASADAYWTDEMESAMRGAL